MFDHTHYVPILRWKGAEKKALKELFEVTKESITPVLEFLPAKTASSKKTKKPPKTLQQLAADMPKEISENWGSKPIFVDAHLIPANNRFLVFSEIFTKARQYDLHLIPVLTTDCSDDVMNLISNVIREDGNGLCIRLAEDDLNNLSVLDSIMNRFDIAASSIDLMIDLKVRKSGQLGCTQLLNVIPDIMGWRTFILSSGSFPVDLSDYEVGTQLCAREDWIAWRDQVATNNLKRKPTFSDYTIQHPVFREPIDMANVSASIRYAANENWIIMRGQGLRSRGSAKHAQYPAHAQLLLGRNEFCGKDFSFGDGYIFDKGQDLNTPNPGTPATWLVAGINHHMTLAVHQVASLFANTTSA